MKEQVIKKRKIAISRMNDKLNLNEVRTGLRNTEGIIAVDVDEARRYFEIEYDLWKINFETIEKSLEKMGVDLSKKITEKWKRGIAKFTEQNEMDNLKATPSSCCEDPREASHKANH